MIEEKLEKISAALTEARQDLDGFTTAAVDISAIEGKDNMALVLKAVAFLRSKVTPQLALAETLSTFMQSEINSVSERHDELANEIAFRHRENSKTSLEVRRKVYESTCGKCFYCGDRISFCAEVVSGAVAGETFHVDHIVPVAHGGPDHLSNYAPACPSCNNSKNDKSLLEFMATRDLTVSRLSKRMTGERDE